MGRGRRGPARCRESNCKAPVVFFRSPYTGRPRTFDPSPVDADHPLAGVRAFPVLGGSAAYKPAELVGVLQVQRECSTAEAEAEIRDMPWHLIHECPTERSPG